MILLLEFLLFFLVLFFWFDIIIIVNFFRFKKLEVFVKVNFLDNIEYREFKLFLIWKFLGFLFIFIWNFWELYRYFWLNIWYNNLERLVKNFLVWNGFVCVFLCSLIIGINNNFFVFLLYFFRRIYK